jgi:cytidine deaminase
MEHEFSYEVYDSIDALSEDDKWLLDEAREATQYAYAPYSQFAVGAAARLSDGSFVRGSNQENASFPAGLCAERVLLAAVAALHPPATIETMAISYHNQHGESTTPITPCGICRQAIQEYTHRTGKPIRLILGGMQGQVYIIPDANYLLPLSFTAHDLKGK